MMAKFIAILGPDLSVAHSRLAAEALKACALRGGYELTVETQNPSSPATERSVPGAVEADVVLLVGAPPPSAERFKNSKVVAVSASDLIAHTSQILRAAAGAGAVTEALAAPLTGPEKAASETATLAKQPPTKLVAITSCPTGIAHTFMAAAALRKAAEELGYEIKVETQGSVGAKNTLTADEIRLADAAIIAADTHVDTSRFAGVRLFTTSTKEAIHAGKEVIAQALALPQPTSAPQTAGEARQEEKRQRTGPYKHLMTGVSYMLPIIIAGGLLIALSFAVGGIHAGDNTGTLGWALMQIGGATAFKLYVPVLAAFIAYSIADRPGICPGLVGGMLSASLGAGFLGGIAAGFLAGYLTKFLNDYIKLPKELSGLKPVLVLPLLSTLIVGLTMIYVVGMPVKVALGWLTAWLNGMQQSSALVLGLLLGAMMAFDMGGPVNKAAYTFSLGMLASNVFGPMAAVMAAGMTPPLGIALATVLFKRRFTALERDGGKATAILGLSFITEGAIPYAAEDPFRVIPCLMVGSAVTGAISMATGVQLMVPHGGVFVLFIPNAVHGLLSYVGALLAGTVITALALGIVKKSQPLPEE
jgi:PTS system fructose-specific IIC component